MARTRRSVLGALTALAAGNGGCLRLTSSESTAPADGGTAVGDTLRLTALGAPETVELLSEYEVTARVENTGSRAQTLTTQFQSTAPERDWIDIEEVDVRVGAGETRDVSETFWHERVERVRLRLRGFDRTVEFEVTPARRSMGEELEHPDGNFAVRVEGVDAATEVSYERDDGSAGTLSAPDGRQFVFTEVTFSNPQGEPLAPPPGTFLLVADGAEYEPSPAVGDVDAGNFTKPYAGDRFLPTLDPVPQGMSDTGWVCHSIPESVDPDALSVLWRNEIDDANIRAYWS